MPKSGISNLMSTKMVSPQPQESVRSDNSLQARNKTLSSQQITRLVNMTHENRPSNKMTVQEFVNKQQRSNKSSKANGVVYGNFLGTLRNNAHTEGNSLAKKSTIE